MLILRSALVLVFIMIFADSAHAKKSWDFEYSYVVALVNMTPDAEASKVSNACVETIRATIDRENWQANLKKVGEAKARMLVDQPKDKRHFFDWEASRFKGEGWVQMEAPWPKDTKPGYVLLIDCRPEKNLLDMLLVEPSHEWTRKASIRDVQLSKGLLEAAAKRIL